jgi:lincosamide nucleotidyltransferase A/C/D/E
MDMSADDVAAILDRLEGAGLTVWVDGGWGIDALVGRQTRPHDDLDLVVRRDEVPAVERELAGLGYVRAGGTPPMSFESVDAEGRQVDSHPVAADGTYLMRDGDTWRYPLPERETPGVIGDRSVRCLDVETQLVCHTGYEPLDLDRHRHDIALLESLRRWSSR